MKFHLRRQFLHLAVGAAALPAVSRVLGQQFIVENVTGAGGTIGSTRAARARPDGYTILMGDTGTHAFSVSFYPNLAYKPDVDFEPIGAVDETPLLIIARKDLPPRDLKEFIAYVKGNAEKLNVGHAGVNAGIKMYRLAGVKMHHGPDATTAVFSGTGKPGA